MLGLTVLVSESLLGDITSPTFKPQVENDLGVLGDWKSDPEKILTVMVEAAKQ